MSDNEHNNEEATPTHGMDPSPGREEATSDENARVKQTKPCKESSEHGQIFNPSEALAIAMQGLSDFNASIENSPNQDFTADEEGRIWLDYLGQAAIHYARGGTFTTSVERDDALWRQHVDNEGELLTPGKPRTGGKDSEGGSRVSGERAIFKLSSAIGLGTVVQVPLWHTGMWLTLRAPTDSALLELERRIAQEKIDLGRHTNGMIFSNSSVYIHYHLINFIINHVYDSSLKTTNVRNLKEAIDARDIPLMVWGILCTIYPNGYNFSQPCTANPEKCQHVTSERLNITKLCWTDNAALSAKQKNHMAKRTEKFKQDDLNKYRDEHTHGIPRTVKVHENLSVKFKVPSIAKYEKSGFKWVDSLERMVEESFAAELKGNERNEYINLQGRATALRQYAHWISELHLSDGDIIDDEDTIDEALNRISSQRGATDTIFEELNKFIDDSTISLIALPKYNCPSCQAPQGEEHERYPHLIPLGVSQIFFTLLDQRIRKVVEEETGN